MGKKMRSFNSRCLSASATESQSISAVARSRLFFSRSGFTLLEVAVGIILFAVVLMLLNSFVLTGYQSAASSGNLTNANSVASSTLEILKGKLADNSIFEDYFDQIEDDPNGEVTVNYLPITIQGISYARSAVLSKKNILIQAEVTVTWQAPTGKEKELQLSRTFTKMEHDDY